MRTNEKKGLPAAAPRLADGQAEILLGEFHALMRQIGSGPEPFWFDALDAPAALARFLEDYLGRLLLPCELPAIVAARGHARRGEWRELMALDERLAEPLRSTPFCAPSRRMGRLQLARLRPLRDDRMARRYLAAVEAGRSHGWHTVVYGMTLAIYSLPLRQGLLCYARETLSALARAADRGRNFGELEMDELLARLLAQVPKAVEAALASEGNGPKFD